MNRGFVRRSLLRVTALAILVPWLATAQSWVPDNFSIPPNTISPNGKYGVMLPGNAASDAPDKLVDMKTGKVLADIGGETGWADKTGESSMRWGDMEAYWSADSTTLCWIHPGKWAPESYTLLKLSSGNLAWQVEVMQPADREILSRTDAAKPLNFAIGKLDNLRDGSAFPEGFTIDVSEPPPKFSLPLVLKVSLISDLKKFSDTPSENAIRSYETMKVGTDGSLAYYGLKVRCGDLTDSAIEQVKEQAPVPLVNTDLGKAMLFPHLTSRNGRYAVAWTLQPAAKGVPPVDWSHWDPADPDKLLRLYDWGYYTREDENAVPYKVVDFVLDTQSGKTAGLPLANRGWSTQRDGRETIAMWGEEGDRVKYGLVANGYDGYDWVTDQNRFEAENILLVNLESTRMQVKDVMPDLRKRIDDLLSERRPDVAAKKFIVSYPIKAGDTEMSQNDFVEIPFEASPLNSNLKEFQLVGTVKFRISDGEVVGAFSDQKRLNPFIDNEALKKADEKLKSVFQALLKSLPPADAAALKQQELKWIVQRDSDAAQAVNLTPVDARQPDWEAVRETSLLESTKKRIEELQSPINRTTSPP